MISRRIPVGRRLRDYIAQLQSAHRKEKFRSSGRTKGARRSRRCSLGYTRVNQLLSGWMWNGYDGAGRNDWRTGPRGTNRNRGNGSSIFP
ncbi:hypothetical protein ALC57_16318 [Trachymyrmex cornetzi]|uniref:Uncharacterized protein n=1 Tax=Trachymyrmex cornetzi TaxID=471704 RepID=A0A195DGD8_9HYME|nr:hypothetical protein ALC57_16318 [Trachymyrmex cornetzi]